MQGVRSLFRCSLPLLLATVLAGAVTPEEAALRPYAVPPAPDVRTWPRERLLGFMKELADFVEKNHVVTDPARKTHGMVYEFWKDGRKMQEFGLDTMHDGAWYMSALVTAHRADPKGGWLARAQKYQVPFYTNMLNQSDAIFLRMQPTAEDRRPWGNPVKGWAPRGWDDGSGIDRKTGKPMPDGYFTGSNHLSQELADALLNVWLATRDLQVAEALQHLRDYKQRCFGDIQGLEIAAAVSAGQADAFLKYRLPEFSPAVMTPYYTGFFGRKAAALPVYDDGLAWSYRQGTAAALIAGQLPRGLAAFAVGRCYGVMAAMEAYFDQRPADVGAWFFDLQRPPACVEGTGKLDSYDSGAKCFYGSRGVQFAWVGAGVLPELKASPALWEGMVQRYGPGGQVRMVDEAPATDAVKEPVYGKSTPLGEESARVTLISDPRNLHVFIETTRPEVTVTFQEDAGGGSAPQAAGRPRATTPVVMAKSKSAAARKKRKSSSKKTAAPAKEKTPPGPVFIRGGKLTVTHEGACQVVNEKGEPLLAASSFKPAAFKQGEGDGWIVEVRIPYTFMPAQNAWINGVDFGRYRVGIDAAPQQSVVMVSEAERVRKRLEAGVIGAIDYWHRVWKQSGVIPSGWRAPAVQAGSWELSDAGGYAHLMQAIALWVIYQDGRREWEIIREQFPEKPNPAPPLPASVLRAQGL